MSDPFEDIVAQAARIGVHRIPDLVRSLPDEVTATLVQDRLNPDTAVVPPSPLELAQRLDPGYVPRTHLTYLNTRVRLAVEAVEGGRSQRLRVSMPPRMGKSQLLSIYLPYWLLRRHPDWPIGLLSGAPDLATDWGRTVRRLVERNPDTGLDVAPDAGAVTEWQTTAGGRLISKSTRQKIVGRGFRVAILDDVVADFVTAHSVKDRNRVWDWWLTDLQTRLEPPYLIVAVGTRWHEDDFIGRLSSTEYPGDPGDWEVVEFPAVAEDADQLGRAPGEPLLSPLLDEDPDTALARWTDTKASVGSYTWAALYQQSPRPAQGGIVNMDWYRFWTVTPGRETDDGRTILLDPREVPGGLWLESWDCAFKGTDTSDYVVGQRWVRHGVRRMLTGQQRRRMTFTQTVAAMLAWADDKTTGVHLRLVEAKANGDAVMDVLKDKVDGLIGVNPRDSKEARLRAVTPEMEAGNVYLPHPLDPGNEWVQDLLDELRAFPNGAHDDQVDAMSQALNRFRDHGQVSVSNPATRPVSVPGRGMQATPPRATGQGSTLSRTRVNPRTPGGPR